MVKRLYKEGEVVEYRRIIKSGDSFVISIPKSWLNQNRIELRDELECRITKNRIVVSNKKIRIKCHKEFINEQKNITKS